jgi:cytochrome c biogenesis protein CcmG/thiol:disulfide interchange protein DsbE
MDAKLAAILLVSAGLAGAQPFVRAELRPVDARKPAPAFVLKDAQGKTVQLSKYRGKVAPLDFWATWCTGCKQEIPWFLEFQKKYGLQGFDLFLIDKKGRVAAAYTAGLVDREDVEANIQTMLGK